ncbi:MAG: hypothetical protein IKE43_07800 [Coriobacteriales bacterium]|nr:hypothetical protein [Coriobacteriales bacterium]
MKSIQEITSKLVSRYRQIWADELTFPGKVAWPYRLPVGKPSRTELEYTWASISEKAREIADWAYEHHLSTATELRLVGRVSYSLLTHVVANSIDDLAFSCGMSRHLELYRNRLKQLEEAFPACSAQALKRVLTLLDKYTTSDLDFELVIRASQWFITHDSAHMTPREVPLEGFHAKWLDLNAHQSMICLLSSKEELPLKERPRTVSYHYLDPAYLATGARIYDTWFEGDTNAPAYIPCVVVICENRDSALWFKPVTGGIAVLGDGLAGTAILPKIPWISQAERIYYWGDIDIAGFTILSKYRERGLRAQSLLMDEAAYKTYERYGTNTDKYGKPLLPVPKATELAGLTPQENSLYLELCSPSHQGPRRIEQERIPLQTAQELVEAGQK